MQFFHGTSSALKITGTLLPALSTLTQRENRTRNIDVVFITKSKPSAEKYARKACEKYGGTPVVLTITPVDDCYRLSNTEWICKEALVIKCDRLTKQQKAR